MIGTTSGHKSILVAAVNAAAEASGLHAARLIKRLLHGKGGGSAQLAQGGGLSADRLCHVLESVSTTLHQH